jgi:hypothetical protein
MEVETMRVRLKRSVFIDGEHRESGEIRDLPADLAEYLVACQSATPCFWDGVKRFVVRRFGRVRFGSSKNKQD